MKTAFLISLLAATPSALACSQDDIKTIVSTYFKINLGCEDMGGVAEVHLSLSSFPNSLNPGIVNTHYSMTCKSGEVIVGTIATDDNSCDVKSVGYEFTSVL